MLCVCYFCSEIIDKAPEVLKFAKMIRNARDKQTGSVPRQLRGGAGNKEVLEFSFCDI